MLKEEAIALFGSKAALAAALGVSRSAISMWPDEKPIPEKRALQIKYELRPRALKRPRAA